VVRDRARDGAGRWAAAERWVAAAHMEAAVGCLLSNEKQNGTERWAQGS
jgi:hypothetical protein